jgi:hypothetical protein
LKRKRKMTEEEFWGRRRFPDLKEEMVDGEYHKYWAAGPSDEEYYDAVLKYFERSRPSQTVIRPEVHETFTEGTAAGTNKDD